MALVPSALVSSFVLAGSMRLVAAFYDCSDDDPPPPPANAQDGLSITVGDQPAHPSTVVITGTLGPAPGASTTVGSSELTAQIQTAGEVTFIYIGQLVAQPSKTLGTGGKAPTPVGGTAPVVSPGGSGSSAVSPVPKKLARLWRSPEVETVVMDAQTLQAIEADGHPLRFAFSLPFGSAGELLASGIETIWIEALDLGGQSVLPAGAQLVSTPALTDEWPTTSVILWPGSALPVISLSFDLVDAFGAPLEPSALGCGTHPVVFRMGLSTSDVRANWDFGWCAGLWRTETEVGSVGAGTWLGWHAGSFDALPALNGPPQIVALTDLLGTPLTTVARGAVLRLTVLGGFLPGEIEVAVGGFSMQLLGHAAGASPGESVYTLLVPGQAQVGPSSLFFRNLGATMASNPDAVQQVVAGFDYVPVLVR